MIPPKRMAKARTGPVRMTINVRYREKNEACFSVVPTSIVVAFESIGEKVIASPVVSLTRSSSGITSMIRVALLKMMIGRATVLIVSFRFSIGSHWHTGWPPLKHSWTVVKVPVERVKKRKTHLSFSCRSPNNNRSQCFFPVKFD